MSNVNSNICAETAPEWLRKLEDRREKLSRGKLLHELGAGAPCADCGDKCPGLDLHFWRKVCRNCKCRKEVHSCTDDEFSGWAQYEVLGQIRSKPAFIKIKTLANQPLKLEWVPPNCQPDVVSDYMQKLGPEVIPIIGSEAAKKRKQKLEYQMPLHDLDATLCHNLSESEALQLQQYVQKIRASCVGQGNVIRVGSLGFGQIGFIANIEQPEYAKAMAAINEVPLLDPVLSDILSAEKLTTAIANNAVIPTSKPKPLVVFAKPINANSPSEFEHEPHLSYATKAKLCGFDRRTLASLVYNGPIYDKILGALKEKNFDISKDPTLNAIEAFRLEYTQNPKFKAEVDDVAYNLERTTNKRSDYTTPIKSKATTLAFNSPQPLKQLQLQARSAEQLQQETPMRKVKFSQIETVLYECGLPNNLAYEQDTVFYQILNSLPLKKVLVEHAKQGFQPNSLVIAKTPLQADFANAHVLSQPVKALLNELPVSRHVLQSVLLNGPFYDRLFETLENKKIDFSSCNLLAPLKCLRSQLLLNQPLYEELQAFIKQKPPQSLLTGSRSHDSGFGSIPTTPSTAAATYATTNEVQAIAGKFVSIPGIEDMNMYTDCKPTEASKYSSAQSLQNMKLTTPYDGQHQQKSNEIPILKCQDCVLPIEFGEVAVKAERAGHDSAWHPECFKCHSCRELLVDLVYFFHGGNVYCGRDLAIKLKIPRCKACDELIFTKEYTAAEDATFHIKHFCCYHCDEPLAGKQYIPDEKSNMPLCLKCYEDYFAAACELCKLTIAGQGIAWQDVHWHAECFLCAGRDCGKSLIGGRFCVKENMPFCSPACVRSIIK